MTSHSQWHGVGRDAAGIYERYLVPAMFAPWAPRLIDEVRLQPGERVLDVACGTGVVTRLAAERVGSDGRVSGLDINAAMLAIARNVPGAEHSPIEWIEASALEMPFPDESFDVILCQQGLQQFPDRHVALGEMHRVLVHRGRLAASVWSRIETSPGMAALVDALEAHVGVEAANNRRAPFALGDADELFDLLTGAGFTGVSIRTQVETTRFPSPDALVEAQMAATPLSTLGSLSEDTRQAITRDVRSALRQYLHDGVFAAPMEAHVALARR